MIQDLTDRARRRKGGRGIAGEDRGLVRPLHAIGGGSIRRTACSWTSPARRIFSAAKRRCWRMVRATDRGPRLCRARPPSPAHPGGEGAGAFRAETISPTRRGSAGCSATLPIAALDCGEEKSARAQTRGPQDHRRCDGRGRAELASRWAAIYHPAWTSCWARKKSLGAAPAFARFPDASNALRRAGGHARNHRQPACIAWRHLWRDAGTRRPGLAACWKRISSAPMARWSGSRSRPARPARCRCDAEAFERAAGCAGRSFGSRFWL